MKYLLQAIETSRHRVQLSDAELTKLLTDVQRARDDRSLLLDSLERLLHDLRAQSHSAAFLTRVSKRDAPDYYDVIKNPMDLGLMLKNVKSGKYRSKEAFRKDLDLIWDNCLLYNTEPSHPLRISATLMRKRSHDLLSYIQDSNDVKSALNEWVATHTSLTPAQAKALQSRDAVLPLPPHQTLGYLGTLPPPNAAADQQPTAGPSSQPATAAAADPSTSRLTEAQKHPQARPASPAADQPFENRIAYSVGTGASLVQAAVEERRRGERDEWALNNLLGTDLADLESATRKGKRRLIQPVFEARNDDSFVEDMVRKLSEGQPVSVCESIPGHDAYDLGAGAEAGPSAEPAGYLLPKLGESPALFDDDQRRGHGRREQRGEPLGRPKRRRHPPRAGRNGEDRDAGTAPPKKRRGVELMKKNYKTLKKMKRLKSKFDVLDYCLETDEPLPSSLLVDSDDEDMAPSGGRRLGRLDEEEEEEQKPDLQALQREEQQHRYRQQMMAPTAPTIDEQAWDAEHRERRNPFSHITRSEARVQLRDRIGLLIGNVGFEGAKYRPAEVLTSVAEEFLSSLGRTLRLYTDRYGSQMTPEEIVLHTLHSSSNMRVPDLAKYIFEDTARYANRLDELKAKLDRSWKERLALGEERLITEEDARFFGEESEDLMAGNLPSALDDDFFGFRAMGLDQELGLRNLTVPARLLRPRGAAPRGAQGAGKNKGVVEEAFPPPPPFVRITEAAIPAQIGLLQGFYRELLQRRGKRGAGAGAGADGDADGREGSKARDGEGDGGANGVGGQYAHAPNGHGHGGQEGVNAPHDEQEQDRAPENEGVLYLSDEEQERTTRYRVPPTGKMPKREMWGPKPAHVPAPPVVVAAPAAAVSPAAAKAPAASKAAAGAGKVAGKTAPASAAPAAKGGKGAAAARKRAGGKKER